MASPIGAMCASKVITLLTGASGVNAGLAAITLNSGTAPAALSAAQVKSQNVAADLAERTVGVQYPAVNVYCEKVINKMGEKFRSFSGVAQMAVEIRHSQDRLDGLQDNLELYADAVGQALEAARGDWGDGMYYAGGYEISYAAAKQGGKNFLQPAKINFQIGVSRS